MLVHRCLTATLLFNNTLITFRRTAKLRQVHQFTPAYVRHEAVGLVI